MLFMKRGDRVPAEAAALTAAAGCPGVVELAGLDEGVLRTRRVDGCSVAELESLAPEEVAGLAAAAATALADLHDLGLAHGGLDASHVLVGVDGQVRLCSLGRDGRPADDVAALGELVADLLDQADPSRPSSRPARRRPSPAGPGGGRARGRAAVAGRLGPMLQPPAGPALRALATEATDPDPARRPTARAFATAIRERAPSARVPVPPPRRLLPATRRGPGRTRRPLRPEPGAGARPTAPNAAGWRRRARPRPGAALPRLVLAAGLVGSAALVVLVDRAVSAGARRNDAAVDIRPRVRATAPPTTTTTEAPASGTTGAPTTSTGAPASGTAGAPTTSTGAPASGTAPPAATRVWPAEPVQFADGVLTLGRARFALGQAGDEVATGDWTCTGRTTVALLRPATGEVFAFDGWAEGDEGLAGRPLAQVEGGTSLRAVDADGDGCDDLAVERPGQAPVVVEAGP